MIAEYPDGVFFVPLDTLDNESLVAPAILQALGLREAVDQPPPERLVQYVRDRHLLLVLDNFEQIMAAAPLVGDLLRAGEGLRIMVTSRATLHLYGEREYAVPPLGVPEIGAASDLQELAGFEAVALFVQRATAVKPDFAITPANAAAVIEICNRLDGLPLAIELAAARIKFCLRKRCWPGWAAGSMPWTRRHEICRRVSRPSGRDPWSYDLLPPEAQRLFARFAAFVGGAGLDAALAVCGDGGIDVLAGLGGLVDQSLIRQEEFEGEPRFAMLLTIREFALERLKESGEADAISACHAAFFLDLSEASAPGLTGPDQKRLLDELAREGGNLRAAITWSVENRSVETALRLGFALWRFWQMRGMLQEGAAVVERILAVPDPEGRADVAGKALEAAGSIADWQADMPRPWATTRPAWRSAARSATSGP